MYLHDVPSGHTYGSYLWLQVEVQASLIEIAAPPEGPTPAAIASRWRAASRPILRLLGGGTNGPLLVQEYLELARSPSAPPGALRLLQALSSPTGKDAVTGNKGKPEVHAVPAAAEAASGRAEVLSAFCDRLLGLKERPSGAMLGTYARLMATLTAEEFAEKVIPQGGMDCVMAGGCG